MNGTAGWKNERVETQVVAKGWILGVPAPIPTVGLAVAVVWVIRPPAAVGD